MCGSWAEWRNRRSEVKQKKTLPKTERNAIFGTPIKASQPCKNANKTNTKKNRRINKIGYGVVRERERKR